MPPVTFHPGIHGDPTTTPPTTLPPQYHDMGYRAQYLLMNQAQQLGSLAAGFQHPMAKQTYGISLYLTMCVESDYMLSSMANTKPSEEKHMVYQQGPGSAYRQPGQRRPAVKRPHDQTLEHEEEQSVELELVERGIGLFPSDSEGGRGDRRVISELGDQTPHQLKWRANMIETWQGMCDAALIDL